MSGRNEKMPTPDREDWQREEQDKKEALRKRKVTRDDFKNPRDPDSEIKGFTHTKENGSIILKSHDDPMEYVKKLDESDKPIFGEAPFESYKVSDFYNAQRNFQRNLENIKELPIDSVTKFQYHVTAMQEEIGELLKADKRWKTHRNERYEKAEKLDEFADMYITLMNIALYSDFSSEDVEKAIANKMTENTNRVNSKK